MSPERGALSGYNHGACVHYDIRQRRRDGNGARYHGDIGVNVHTDSKTSRHRSSNRRIDRRRIYHNRRRNLRLSAMIRIARIRTSAESKECACSGDKESGFNDEYADPLNSRRDRFDCCHDAHCGHDAHGRDCRSDHHQGRRRTATARQRKRRAGRQTFSRDFCFLLPNVRKSLRR